MATIDLKKYLPTSLINEFWEDFCDAISDDLELIRAEVALKKNYFYIKDITDVNTLIEISNTFGFTIDRSIDDSVAYLKDNIGLTVNRIKHKTTYAGYHYIFSLAKYYGLVYNYFVQNSYFTRGIDQTQIITNLNAITDYSIPFIAFTPELYYKSIIQNFVTLDETPLWYLDENVVTELDQVVQRAPTVHLAIEYVPQILIDNTKNINISDFIYQYQYEYMNTTYLDYLYNASLYNKKVTEIPHIGVQVNFITDESGYYNNLSTDATYSTPDLQLVCSTTQKNFADNERWTFYFPI